MWVVAEVCGVLTFIGGGYRKRLKFLDLRRFGMKHFVALFLLALFVVNGCGGGDGEETASGITCNFRNQQFTFPDGTTCRGLSIMRSDLINSGNHWYCRYRNDGSVEKYEFFSDGTVRAETNFTGIGERRINLSWSLDQPQCGLWFGGGLLAQCGNRVQFQINDVDDDSLELEVEDPENRGLTIVADCSRRSGRL